MGFKRCLTNFPIQQKKVGEITKGTDRDRQYTNISSLNDFKSKHKICS